MKIKLLLIILILSFYSKAQNDSLSSNFRNTIKKEKIYDVPSVMAKFKGGDEALYKYLNKHLRNKYQPKGHVPNFTFYIQFIVNKNGSIKNVKILKPKDSFNDKQKQDIISVFQNMPRWTPAKHEGKTVASRFIIPIRICPR